MWETAKIGDMSGVMAEIETLSQLELRNPRAQKSNKNDGRSDRTIRICLNIWVYIYIYISAVGNHLHQEVQPATVQWAKGLLLSAQKQDQINEFMFLDCSCLLRTVSRPGDPVMERLGPRVAKAWNCHGPLLRNVNRSVLMQTL